jgi:hypothetical protein
MVALVDLNSPDSHPDASGHPSGRELPIAEAAAQLNTSTEALRKRIARGSLHGFKRDRQWFVVLDDAPDTSGQASGHPSGHPPESVRTGPDEQPDPSGQPSGQPSGHEILVSTLQEQVDFLRHELDGRNREIEMLHEEARRRDHLLAALAQGLTQIEAPKPAESAPVVENAPQSAPQRPWWRFW